MKNAVPTGVQFKILDRANRVPIAQHVMPLQHLVKNDPVEEAA
jgi:hypothetical protein